MKKMLIENRKGGKEGNKVKVNHAFFKRDKEI